MTPLLLYSGFTRVLKADPRPGVTEITPRSVNTTGSRTERIQFLLSLFFRKLSLFPSCPDPLALEGQRLHVDKCKGEEKIKNKRTMTEIEAKVAAEKTAPVKRRCRF